MARDENSLPAAGQGVGGSQPWKNSSLQAALAGLELQLAWCKSLAVVTKKDTQMQVLSPSLLPLKARSAAAVPELELSLSCAFRRATSWLGLSTPESCQASGDFPRQKGVQQWLQAPRVLHSLQPGRTIRMCQFSLPSCSSNLLWRRKSHSSHPKHIWECREVSGLLQISGEGEMLPSSQGKAHRALQLNLTC